VRLPIENCRSWFRFLCPRAWSQLERTGQLNVRHCPTCRRDVHYCETLEDVEEHRRAGHCLVVAVEEDGREADFLGMPEEVR
jgi:hypothetical protein